MLRRVRTREGGAGRQAKAAGEEEGGGGAEDGERQRSQLAAARRAAPAPLLVEQEGGRGRAASTPQPVASAPLPSPPLRVRPRPATAFGRLPSTPRDPWAVVRSFEGQPRPATTRPASASQRSGAPSDVEAVRFRSRLAALAHALEAPDGLHAARDAALAKAEAAAAQRRLVRYREWRTAVFEPLQTARAASAAGGRRGPGLAEDARQARVSDPLSRALRADCAERSLAAALGLAPAPTDALGRALEAPLARQGRAPPPPGARSAFERSVEEAAPRRARRAAPPPLPGCADSWLAARPGRRDGRSAAQREGTIAGTLRNESARPSTPGVASRRERAAGGGIGGSGRLLPFGPPLGPPAAARRTSPPAVEESSRPLWR